MTFSDDGLDPFDKLKTGKPPIISPLKRLWRAWMKFAHGLGNLMSWVWLSLFYFTLAMPVALIIRFVADPLRIRVGGKKTFWTPKEMPPLDMNWAKNQGSLSPEAKDTDKN